jgi:phosphoribosyl 1,2-cyclic phosphate phosphodiesterase
LKVTFLGSGTSQGVPVIACGCEVCQSVDPRDNRLRCSLLIEIGNLVIVIDSGPDFRQQMLREKVKRLDAILFTHEHKDHIAGMDDIRAFNYLQQSPIDVYAEDRVLRAIQQEFSYVFAELKYPGVPQVTMHTIENKEFMVHGLPVVPVRAMHMRLPVLGFRLGDLAYLTDANYIAEDEKEKLFGVKYLIVNGLRKQKHISHFTLGESLSLIKELSPKRAYITHISHQMGLHDQVQKELPPNVFLGHDGLSFEVI